MTFALAAACLLAAPTGGAYLTDSRLQGSVSLREVLAPMDKVVKDQPMGLKLEIDKGQH